LRSLKLMRCGSILRSAFESGSGLVLFQKLCSFGLIPAVGVVGLLRLEACVLA
jgi:hypothetical protein